MIAPEAFLELLWRGLRRVAPGAALSSLASAHPVGIQETTNWIDQHDAIPGAKPCRWIH